MVKNGRTKKRYHKPPKPQHHSTSSAAEKNKTITVKTLPADLVLEILYRTQVKALVRSHHQEMSGRFVVLWNPSTHYWNPIALKNWDNVSVGFGFDALQSDYKVICIVPETRLGNLGWSRVEIYSTNRGSWENVDGKDIIPFWPISGLHHCHFIVKGVPYWIGTDVQARDAYVNLLGRIDPVTGLYKRVVYPSHLENKGRVWVNPLKWKDSVATVVLFPDGYPNQMVDLYVLLDEDTSKWTKMYSLVPPSLISDLEGTWVPQCFSTGEIVFELSTQDPNIVQNLDHCICDPETGRVFRNNEIEALIPFWHESYSHVESLVCVKGMIQIGKEHKDKKSSPKMKNWTEFLSKEFESVLHL